MLLLAIVLMDMMMIEVDTLFVHAVAVQNFDALVVAMLQMLHEPIACHAVYALMFGSCLFLMMHDTWCA